MRCTTAVYGGASFQLEIPHMQTKQKVTNKIRTLIQQENINTQNRYCMLHFLEMYPYLHLVMKDVSEETYLEHQKP